MAIGKQQKQAAEAAGGVGLNPTQEGNFVSGGGLYDDFDGEILEMAFVPWDYDGSVDPPVLALAVEIMNEEEEAADGKNPFIQYYSAGKLEHFVPSDDGKQAIPVGSKTGLSNSTNAYEFLMSTVSAGFEASRIGQRVDVFEHSRFHFRRQEQKERKGLKQKAREDGRKREILLAESLLSYPEDKTKPAKPGIPRPGMKAATPPPGPSKKGPTPPPMAGGRPSAPPPPPTTTTSHSSSNGAHAVDEVVSAWAQAYILEVLEAAGGAHPKLGLAKGLVAWAKQQQGLDIPTRNKVLQALGNDAWLSTEDLGWVYDGADLVASA